jgi:hypothetical protein
MNTVLDQFDPTKHYFKDPYPHIIIEDCLPQNLYNDLYNSFPVKEIKQTLPLIIGHTYRYLADDVMNKKLIPVSSVWQDFFEAHTSQKYYKKVLDIFKDDLPNIEWFKKPTSKCKKFFYHRSSGYRNTICSTQSNQRNH